MTAKDDTTSPPTATKSTKSGKTKKKDKPFTPLLRDYKPLEGAYDEMFNAEGLPRENVQDVMRLLDGIGTDAFRNRHRLAEAAMLQGGITFTVYGQKQGVERVFPFDPIPRVISSTDWDRVQVGLKQRIRALNMFLADVYGDQRIFEDNHLLRDVVKSSSGFYPELVGLRPPGNVYVQIAGIDLIRDENGNFLVLEDNLRCPSGVSYVLENRAVMKRVLPHVFGDARVRSVDAYPSRLRQSLVACAPKTAPEEPTVVVLSPGPFNSAYFEHSFLARLMGCDLVVPGDLFVDDDRVFVKTTHGPVPVDVIYRRIDDEFIDPKVFRKDSLLGVPGIVGAYRAGNVTLANALGNGVADDKAVYPFVPEMIRFYLDEEAQLGQVRTLMGARPADCAQMLDDLAKYVVKSVDASGGYGMIMGPSASQRELAEFADKIRAEPRGYIAQPLVELSTCPTWVQNTVGPRRVDLRPYILTGDDSWVLPGGLTRVALTEGSYVVNSSQGGGSKDTWIVEETQ